MESKFDFSNNLNFLISTEIDTNNIKKQSKILNSKDYNSTYKSVEDSLNLLYEKTRTLQNIIDYSNSFIKSEIDNTVTECKSLLDSIENNRDLLKDSAYINYNIKLQSIFDTYSDRNNTPIKGVNLHNGVITLNNNSVEEVELNNVSVSSKSKNYNLLNTKDDIVTTKNYRSFYMFDRIQKDPIKEKITIHLPKVKTINKINLIPSNCKITSIEFVNENEQTEIVEGYDVNIFKNRNIKSLSINIECNNYMISQIDYNDIKNKDFWDIVEDIKNDENLYVDKQKFYYYLFGLDKISIEYVDKDNNSIFISKELKLEELKENEYISLDSEYVCEEGHIEFYVIDGTTEIPILPESEKKVVHEKVFYKIPTMFTVEDIATVKVYENGVPVKISLNDAMSSTDEKYTVSYTPKGATTINSLLNKTIKVKAVIRSYNKNYIPYIKSIQIKKYGGGALWIDKNKI